jgi:uncharacterized membrane protein (Fun14 family)
MKIFVGFFLAVGFGILIGFCSGYSLQVLAPTSLWAFRFYPAALHQ